MAQVRRQMSLSIDELNNDTFARLSQVQIQQRNASEWRPQSVDHMTFNNRNGTNIDAVSPGGLISPVGANISGVQEEGALMSSAERRNAYQHRGILSGRMSSASGDIPQEDGNTDNQREQLSKNYSMNLSHVDDGNIVNIIDQQDRTTKAAIGQANGASKPPSMIG